MSWKRGSGGPRGYHHGNLKETLIRAALELIAQKGPAGFTFAEAARWAGVSPAAPYRHYRDRDELLADVAKRGFELFQAALAKAWDGGRPDPATAFERLGKAYLEFARSEPAYYSAMFEAGIPADQNAELREAGDRAFGVLQERDRDPDRDHAAGESPAGDDDGAAHLGAVARRRVAVRRAATPRGGRCRCRRRNCWRPARCCICAASGCRRRRRPKG